MAVKSFMKHFDPTQNSAPSEDKLRPLIVELLGSGPCSIAGLYGFLSRTEQEAIGIPCLISLLRKMEKEREILVWHLEMSGSARSVANVDWERAQREYEDWLGHLPVRELTVDEVSVDNVGVWCTLGPSLHEDRDPMWTLDLLDDEGVLRIRAATELEAEAALAHWLLVDRPTKVIEGSKLVKDFGPGVEVTWTLQHAATMPSGGGEVGRG